MTSNAEQLAAWVEENPPASLNKDNAKDAFLWVLWVTHAPHDLEYFEDIINLLPSVLTDLKDLDPNYRFLGKKDLVNRVEDAIELLFYLSSNYEDIRQLCPAPARDKWGLNKRHAMHSRLGIYYVYAAMISSIAEDNLEYENEHTYLKRVILFCHWVLKNNHGDNSAEYLNIDPSVPYQDTKEKSRTTNACRFVRQSCYSDLSTYLEDLEFRSFQPITELYEYAASSKNRDRTPFETIYSLYLELIVKDVDKGSSSGKGGGRGKYKQIFNGWYGGYVRSAFGFYNEEHNLDGSVIDIAIPAEVESPDEIEADLVADENEVADELIFVEDENGKSRRVIQKSQIKHLAVANQMLPFAWNETTIFELTDLLKKIGNVYRSNISASGNELKEALLVLLIMLVTGERLDKVVSKFRVQNEDTSFLSDKIYYVRKQDQASRNGYWRIYPQLAKQANELSDVQQLLCGERIRFIDLPDVLNIGGYILKTFTEAELRKNFRRKLFDRNFKTYTKILENFISIHCHLGSRISIERVRSFLFNTIAGRLTGDTADGTLITGKYHPLSKTKLHYTTLEVSHLQDLYVQALKWMAEQVYQQGYDKPRPNYLSYEPKVGVYIGSNYTPLIASVSCGVGKLVGVLVDRHKPATKEEIRRYHNLYTLYVVLFAGFSTGYRAVKDPFPETPNIDEETGLCAISDKDGPDLYNSRLVWLPEILISQLKHYKEHRDVVKTILVLENNENIELLGDLPQLFFIDENYKVEQIRPSTLKPKLVDILDLPINTNRRFLRSYLKTEGCPTEVIDAFMGHWSRGEEPWGEYSTLSYPLIISELKKYIQKLLDTLGFKPIRSRVYDA